MARIMNLYKYARWFVKGLLNLKVNKDDEAVKKVFNDDGKVRFVRKDTYSNKVIFENVVSH